jgi:hypothetical protein
MLRLVVVHSRQGKDPQCIRRRPLAGDRELDTIDAIDAIDAVVMTVVTVVPVVPVVRVVFQIIAA